MAVLITGTNEFVGFAVKRIELGWGEVHCVVSDQTLAQDLTREVAIVNSRPKPTAIRLCTWLLMSISYDKSMPSSVEFRGVNLEGTPMLLAQPRLLG